MTSSSPGLAPMDHEDAERIARVAIEHGGSWDGARVLEALLARITELELSRALLRRELDALDSRAREDARLRAHAMWAQQGVRVVHESPDLVDAITQVLRDRIDVGIADIADTEGAG